MTTYFTETDTGDGLSRFTCTGDPSGQPTTRLIIGQSQMDGFEQDARHTFENEMVAHLADFSRPLFAAISEEQIRTVVRLGIGRAEGYGFSLRGSIRLYLELMLLFGSHFDTDPQYPWAAEILNREGDEMERGWSLYEHAMEYGTRVAGPEGAYASKALRNLRIRIWLPWELSHENFIPDMRRELADLYPEKVAYVGDAGIEAVIREGLVEAQRQRLATAHGAALLVMLMSILGHRCTQDPLYPWLAETLQDQAVTDSEARAKRLEEKSMTWLEQTLAHPEAEGRR